MNVSDLGEFGLIDRLAKTVGISRPESLIAGIGDDAAAWRLGDSVVLATTDTLIAGVHFLADITPMRDLGWKALAVNVSDIAAMGGVPQFALVTLALPPDTPVPDIDEMYAGLQECAERYGVTIAGGDVVRAPQLSLTVALLGRADLDAHGGPRLLRRDAARLDDAIAVTGTLGDSAAGLRRLKAGAPLDGPLARAHLRPHPPLAAGQRAAASSVACGIDVSDGLLQDLGHVCRASGLGAVVRADSVPMAPALRDTYPEESLSLACAGGEDYELLLVAPENKLRSLAGEVDVPLTIIGQMVEDSERRVRLLDASGAELLLPSGWDHLRP